MPAVTILTTKPSSWGPIFPITIQKGNVILAAAKNAGREVVEVFGYNNAPTSDHRFKQCIDFMHYGDPILRNWLEKFLLSNAHNLGIMGMISNGRCMGFPPNETNPADCEVYWNGPDSKWRPYTGTTNMHTDHVHVQFNTAQIIGKPTVNGRQWFTMYCTRTPTKGYDVHKVGVVKHTRKRGFVVRGYLIHRSDGPYLETKWGTLYPMDSLSHVKPQK